jgi:hypothetical protein
MTIEPNAESVDFSVDRQNLYQEESFTDMKVATIRRLTPVKADGTVDKTRKTIFIGETNILTPNGPLPLQAVIQAKQLQQAIKNFPNAMQTAVDKLAEEVKKMKEKQNSSIIAPGSGQQDSRIIVPGR